MRTVLPVKPGFPKGLYSGLFGVVHLIENRGSLNDRGEKANQAENAEYYH